MKEEVFKFNWKDGILIFAWLLLTVVIFFLTGYIAAKSNVGLFICWLLQSSLSSAVIIVVVIVVWALKKESFKKIFIRRHK